MTSYSTQTHPIGSQTYASSVNEYQSPQNSSNQNSETSNSSQEARLTSYAYYLMRRNSQNK